MLSKMNARLVQLAGNMLAIVLLSLHGAASAATIPDRIGALRAQAIAAGKYAHGDALFQSEQAQAWLDFGYEEYVEKDGPLLVEYVLHRVPQLIEAAENGMTAADELPPLGDRILPELWQKLAEGKSAPQFNCTAAALGRLEVQLNWAAHELHELGPRHAQRYVEDAEAYARRVEQQSAACPGAAAVVAPAATEAVVAPAAEPAAAPDAGTVGTGSSLAQQLIELPSVIHFAFASDELSPQSVAVLQRVSATLRSFPSLRLQVVGHTDLSGNESRNQALSQRRADRVRDWLVASGLPPVRFETQAMGKRRPLMSGRDTLVDARNRRVELVVFDQAAVPPGSGVVSEPQEADLQPDDQRTGMKNDEAGKAQQDAPVRDGHGEP